MTHAKTAKATYWITTSLLFLFEGLMPALTANTQLAVDGIRNLGYPDYFRVMLTAFKVLGAAALILPAVHRRVKEWAYAGFAFNLISAFVSHWAVDGLGVQTFFPLFIFALLVASYASYHKLRRSPAISNPNVKTTTHVIPGLS